MSGSNSDSTLSARLSSSEIVAQRPPRGNLDPGRPYHFLLERERTPSGEIADSAVIFLTNSECPWRCLMCDLWKNTLPGRTPPGAIPRQIDFALDQLGRAAAQIKLYNSGSFFDRAAVPPQDYPAIAGRVGFARNVVVESHPRLVGARCLRFRDLLRHGRLEIAMGLETIHPEILPRLNKNMSLAHFSRACEFLHQAGVATRAFLLVGLPFLDPEDALAWAIQSARFAYENGVSAVSLIPTRPGNGALDRLIETGEFLPPTLRHIERAFDSVLSLGLGRVFADTWDLEIFSQCPACLPKRASRLVQMNLSQQRLPEVQCPVCASASGGKSDMSQTSKSAAASILRTDSAPSSVPHN